jgi:hypothetical protein
MCCYFRAVDRVVLALIIYQAFIYQESSIESGGSGAGGAGGARSTAHDVIDSQIFSFIQVILIYLSLLDIFVPLPFVYLQFIFLATSLPFVYLQFFSLF